jgi:hypothetical protein
MKLKNYSFHVRFTDGKLDGITSSLEEPYDLLSYTFSIWSFSPTSLSPLEERWRRKNVQTLKALLRGEEVDEDDIGQMVRLDAGKLLFTKEIVSYEIPESVGYQYCELPTEEYLALYEQFLTLIDLLRNTCLNRNIANLKIIHFTWDLEMVNLMALHPALKNHTIYYHIRFQYGILLRFSLAMKSIIRKISNS